MLRDDVHKRLAAERMGQRPRLGFGAPHERSEDLEALSRAEVDGVVELGKGFVAAIRIARIIGLAHAAYEIADAAAVGQRCA